MDVTLAKGDRESLLAMGVADHFIFFGQVRYFLLCQTDSGSKTFAKVERKGAPLRDSEAPGLWRVQDVEHKTLFLFQNSPHH